MRRLIASCGEIQFLDRAKYPLFLVKTPIRGSQEMTENLRPSVFGHFLQTARLMIPGWMLGTGQIDSMHRAQAPTPVHSWSARQPAGVGAEWPIQLAG